MEPEIEHALTSDTLIDITTIGKQTGTPRRIEIAFHSFDGSLYITGRPGKRDWYANLVAHPGFIFHLKQSVQADLAATATPIVDPAMRRNVMARVVEKWNMRDQLDAFIASSPLVAVTLAKP